jgi:hypothetical protein
MSRSELSRLTHDVMTDPDMIDEAMAITDRAAMEAFIAARGYTLTSGELDEVWTLVAQFLTGQPMTMPMPGTGGPSRAMGE